MRGKYQSGEIRRGFKRCGGFRQKAGIFRFSENLRRSADAPLRLAASFQLREGGLHEKMKFDLTD
jgi:hypothetical protein